MRGCAKLRSAAGAGIYDAAMRPVQLFCWHFMAYPYLPADFDDRYETGWVTVPNSLWDRVKTQGMYQ